MLAAIREIEQLPTYERDLVRWMLAGLASTDQSFGWYGFASVGLRWIERLLERHQLVTVTHDDHGIAYLISEVGRDLNAQLTERYGMLESFPTRQDDNSETATNADKSANNPMNPSGGSGVC